MSAQAASLQERLAPRKRSISLTARVSALFVLASILPLIIIVISNLLLSRPTIINAAYDTMRRDAQSRVQSIDIFLGQRLQEVVPVSHYADIQQLLLGDTTLSQNVFNELTASYALNNNYENWSVFTARGALAQAYPAAPLQYGSAYIPSSIIQQLSQIGKPIISDVFYDSVKGLPSINLYAPVFTDDQKTFLGTVRATLNISYIWDVVNSEVDTNVPGSYAFILDHNGVRIAYTGTTLLNRPVELFKAIAPFDVKTAQQVKDQGLYGAEVTTVGVLNDNALKQMQSDPNAPTTFEMTPADQNQPYEVARVGSFMVPWTYYLLSPVNIVTASINQQVANVSLIALVVFIVAALIGLVVGWRITQPILSSVFSLRNSSRTLKALATKEHLTAQEQKWMVESSEVGLRSVQYYTRATNVAARKLHEVGAELIKNWQHLDDQTVKTGLNEMVSAARYIETAAARQEESSKSLATAIRVTTQVTEQLASGATSAREASLQLEQVVEQLRSVVGR